MKRSARWVLSYEFYRVSFRGKKLTYAWYKEFPSMFSYGWYHGGTLCRSNVQFLRDVVARRPLDFLIEECGYSTGLKKEEIEKWLQEVFNERAVEWGKQRAPLLVVLGGLHDGVDLLILVEDQEMREYLQDVTEYASLDDDRLLAIEGELEATAWEDWIRSDLLRAAGYTEEEREKLDTEEYAMLCREAYNMAKEETGDYGMCETAYSFYIDVARLAPIFKRELDEELLEKELEKELEEEKEEV